jgi:uncharacterized protein YdhG (YjbR/CyaY superfamily)
MIVCKDKYMTKKSDNPPSNVYEYLNNLPQEEKDLLQRIRKIILSTNPEITERIAYKICVFSFKKDLVGFASQKDFLSFYTMSPKLVKDMEEELSGYKLSGATIHFSSGKPLPPSLIKKIVKARISEIKSPGK